MTSRVARMYKVLEEAVYWGLEGDDFFAEVCYINPMFGHCGRHEKS